MKDWQTNLIILLGALLPWLLYALAFLNARPDLR